MTPAERFLARSDFLYARAVVAATYYPETREGQRHIEVWDKRIDRAAGALLKDIDMGDWGSADDAHAIADRVEQWLEETTDDE